jgi:hypothetical protein
MLAMILFLAFVPFVNLASGTVLLFGHRGHYFFTQGFLPEVTASRAAGLLISNAALALE